ncbi:PIN domain-containing protein [Pyrococcus sp. NA2]|uniref:PIN domain-containing protein n=1 Tax=Pyrococcus sp. (strain NA2) TaxID=342949 RepID=UPI001ED8FA19|nr:PIN domain-containing protein [Pyrococcus sp. NA2]
MFLDTNLLYAFLLENDAHHKLAKEIIEKLLKNRTPIIIPEAVYRDLRRSFHRKYLNAEAHLIYFYQKALRSGLKREEEIYKYVENNLLEYALKHDKKSLNMYQYLLDYIKKNKLFSPEKRPLLTQILDNHLIKILSKLKPVEEQTIHLTLGDRELDIYKDIYNKVSPMFKDEADAEIFCQIAATIASEDETKDEIKYKLCTTDREFAKTGNKAIEILNKEGYKINLEIQYLKRED